MSENKVGKAPLPWWAAGLILGMIQIMAIAMVKPLGASTQFVILDSIAVHKVAPEYAENHPLISTEKYKKIGYGFWLDVGLVGGAFLAAVLAGKWRISSRPVWWKENHGNSLAGRFIISFIGGFLLILGARLAHGCTSGQFASGWAQLSLSVVPFTISLFGAGMITAKLLYPKTPDIE